MLTVLVHKCADTSSTADAVPLPLEGKAKAEGGQTLVKRWDAGFEAAARNEGKGNKKSPAKGEGVETKFSIANTRSMSWDEQTEKYFSGALKSSDSLYWGLSEKYISDISASPRYIPTSVITKALRPPKGSRSAHALHRKDIENLQNGIRNAVAVIYNPERNSVIYITGNKATDRKSGQIIVSFALNNNLYGETAHKSTSIHGRTQILPMLKTLNKDAVIYVRDKNKFDILAGLQPDISPELLAKIELTEPTLLQPDTGVKRSERTEVENRFRDRGQSGEALDFAMDRYDVGFEAAARNEGKGNKKNIPALL